MEKTLEQEMLELKARGYDLIAQQEEINQAIAQNNQKLLQLFQQKQQQEQSKSEQKNK